MNTHVVGVDGAEREVVRWDSHLGQRVEERALAHVGETHDAELQRGSDR